MPRLDEVFKKSGVPTHTFVSPTEFTRVQAAIQTPGRGVIVEGPSGIGKTSCVNKALEALGLLESVLSLSARRPFDRTVIASIPKERNVGTVVIDDFHRLSQEVKNELTDFVKLLADEERVDSKVILIGINRASQSLIEYAPDLLHRVETIRIGRTTNESLRSLISLGETALNCSLAVADEIVTEAEGSFAMAQVLCNEACLAADVLQTAEGDTPKLIEVSLPGLREKVLSDLAAAFFPLARDFATGNRLRREGRAPYLHLLRWLAESGDGVLDTKEALASNPSLKGSVSQVIEKGHLTTLLNGSKEIDTLIHFDDKSGLLTSEDPKFLYFCKHLIWSKFARQVGYPSLEFRGKYDFALSFAGEDRDVAAALAKALNDREMNVFYDKDEQHRIVAQDVEAYLAPIYRSEAAYVIALLSNSYPKKIWTKFESDHFRQRFGEESVVPIWFADAQPGMFDESRRVGGLSIDRAGDVPAQIEDLSKILAAKLTEQREIDARASDRNESEEQPMVGSP